MTRTQEPRLCKQDVLHDDDVGTNAVEALGDASSPCTAEW